MTDPHIAVTETLTFDKMACNRRKPTLGPTVKLCGIEVLTEDRWPSLRLQLQHLQCATFHCRCPMPEQQPLLAKRVMWVM